MFGLLRDLSHWVEGFADSPWAIFLLGANAFTESIFFPIPPDALLLGIAVSRVNAALWLAGLVTIASVAGAVVGYALGKRVGRPLLHRMFKPARVQTVERLFQRYGSWAILIAALTPIPYKVFAIAAGVLDLDLRGFVVASIVGRGLRYFTLGALVFIYGDSVKTFIDQRFELVTIAMTGAVLAAAVVIAIIAWMRRSTDVS